MDNTYNRTIKKYTIGDTDVVYCIFEEGRVGFTIVPSGGFEGCFKRGGVDSLIQISCSGDSSSPGFAAGETRHNSGLTNSMKYKSQTFDCNGNECVITTELTNNKGITARHIVEGNSENRTLCVYTQVINESGEDFLLEKIASFCITNITPYNSYNTKHKLFIHRFKSRWSEEGRHEVRTPEELLLEPSWANFGVRVEKYGAIGSMPIRGYFPFIAVEDKDTGIIWGAVNSCSSSWQIEAVRIDENLSITGGLADYEFGHWRKMINPGDSFTSTKSYLTVAKADLTIVCDRLLDSQREKSVIPSELPVLFNEYCTTWGEPSEKKILEMLSVINRNDFEYFVIDAGWYADSVKGWQDNMGDWRIAPDLFPNGLKPVVDKINESGMKAGIWFELEVVGKDADALSDEAHLLTRDGKIIISGTRRFWDMRMEYVEHYLSEKVIEFLKYNGFKYIKIDYNETIGIGCDGAESYGEGLRLCVEATKKFYRKIKSSIPDIAIEVCSSGGHRLEHGFMETADYLSFSDAHEEKEIPVIALDLQRLILPSKSQIWAVIRHDDNLKRIAYSICAAMYGVMCISGDICELPDEKWEFIRKGMSLYRKASSVISKGITYRFGEFQESNRDLTNYQASVRYGENNLALVIVHSFKHDGLQDIEIPLNDNYYIVDCYETGNHNITILENTLKVQFEESFDAVSVLIQRHY